MFVNLMEDLLVEVFINVEVNFKNFSKIVIKNVVPPLDFTEFFFFHNQKLN